MDKGEKSKRTIFHHLLQLDDVEGYEPSVDFLADEAYIVLGAAADTTGNALTIATYNTVINPDIYQRLTAELKEAFSDPGADIDFTSLEKLPYLVSRAVLTYVLVLTIARRALSRKHCGNSSTGQVNEHS